jgi:hypothetical protein
MRDSMAVVMFSPRGNSGEQWAFGASFPGVVFKHEGTRGGGRLRVDAYRMSGFEACASN